MATAAKIELEKLSEFQKSIHQTTSANDPIDSIFNYEFRKVTWYSMHPVQLEAQLDESAVTFTVNQAYHYLLYTYMRQPLPPFAVKKEHVGKVMIAWCHNIGTNVVESGELLIDDEVINTVDSIWYDIYFQAYLEAKPGARRSHNKGVGNIPCLESWQSSLPAYTTNVDQPFYYSRAPSLAFPIHLLNSQNHATHRYKLRREISQLLRMAKLDEAGVWRSIPVDVTLLDEVKADGKLPRPQLWGRYGYITSNEIGCHLGDKFTFYIDDVVGARADAACKLGSSVTVMPECSSPCKSIVWVAENLSATALNNYSNYTTDRSDLYQGWNPCAKATLKYGAVPRFKDLDSDHFDQSEFRRHFRSIPSEEGYNGHSLAYDSASIDAETGIVPSSLKVALTVTLADTQPRYIEPEVKAETVDNVYQVHVRMLVTRKLELNKVNGKVQVSIS